MKDDNESGRSQGRITRLCDLDQKIQVVILLSDAYGAEGELGILQSEKLMEHDTYCIFYALMSGVGDAISMAEFFFPSPYGSLHTGYPPFIEDSAIFYHFVSLLIHPSIVILLS
ncbi:hypothetical protein CQW23_16782 [Capsicum baccatum]|uniref:Uncharacterized protein n=1 Tax=Capsicum baccatum TaxID=33114 RepID=A0A2G2WC03_CAPBA|nr:hypothetical protein CQW23_16782 [Capsicum baccatum]